MALIPVAWPVASLFLDNQAVTNLTDNVSSAYSSEKLRWMRTRRCRITHGAINWLLSSLTVVLGAELMEHEWVEFETDKAYYVAQLVSKKNTVELKRCSSRDMANWTGYSVIRDSDSDANCWTEVTFQYPSHTTMTVGKVKEWVSQSRCHWNCEDFVKQACHELQHD